MDGIGGGTTRYLRGIWAGGLPTAAMVNHCYCYRLDEDFGPFFLKFCSYFPYNAKLCINGHEYAKRRLRKRGVWFEALDKVELAIKCSDGNTRQATSAYP